MAQELEGELHGNVELVSVSSLEAKRAGAQVAAVHRRCRACGHDAVIHGFAQPSRKELTRAFAIRDRRRSGFSEWREPPCEWQGCACAAWAPEFGQRGPHDTIVGILRRDTWVEVPLVPGERVAAFRFVLQDGAPVIAELRVFPEHSRPRQFGQATPGRWSGELLGMAAEAPEGGLPARVLRRVRLTVHRRYANRVLRDWAKRGVLRSLAGDELPSVDLPRDRPRPQQKVKLPGRRPGRQPGPDLPLAQFAKEYVVALESGSRRPVVNVAARHRMRPQQVRDLIHRARTRGLLTPSSRGASGGGLTERAMTLLGGRGGAMRKKRIAKKRKDSAPKPPAQPRGSAHR